MKKLLSLFSLTCAVLFAAAVLGRVQAQYDYDGTVKIGYCGYSQAPDFDFDVWDNNQKPWGWNSASTFTGNKNSGIIEDYTRKQCVWQDNRGAGNTAVYIKASKSEWRIKYTGSGRTGYATIGTITTGALYFESESGNSNGNSCIRTENGSGSKEWGFTGRPNSVSFWAKSPGHVSNMTLYLHDAGDFKDYGNGVDGVSDKSKVVGYAIYEIPASNDWTYYTVNINYFENKTGNPARLLMSFSAGSSFRTVAENAELYVDDVFFTYNPTVTVGTLTNPYVRHGGTSQQITVPYTLTGTFNPFNGQPDNKVVAYLSNSDGTVVEDAAHKVGETGPVWERSGSVNITVPVATVDGTYKLRLVTTNTRAESPLADITLWREWDLEVNASNRYGSAVCSPGNGTHLHGTSCLLVASESSRDDCIFLGWYENGNLVSAENNMSFRLQQDRTLTAVFDTLYTLRLLASNGINAVITNNNMQEITVRKATDSTITVRAQVQTGYGLREFRLNDNVVPHVKQQEGVYVCSFNAREGGNLSILSDTLVYPYVFFVSSTAHQTVPCEKLGTVSGGGNYKHFTSVKATAVAANQYSRFKYWYDTVNRMQVGTPENPRFTQTGVYGPAVIAAVFEEEFHSVKVGEYTGNWAEGETRGRAWQNDNKTDSTYSAVDLTRIQLFAQAEKGYSFKGWRVKKSGADLGMAWGESAADTVLVNDAHLAADYELSAVFDTSVHILKIEKPNEYLGGVHNNGTVTGEGTYKYGENAVLTAKAAEGYHFVKWVNTIGQTLTGSDTLRVVVFSDTGYTAVFEVNRYKVNIDYDNKDLGYVYPSTGYYRHFENLQLSAHTYENGELRYWVINGDTLGTRPEYNLYITDSADVYAVISYRRCKVSISAEPEANGRETVNGQNPASEPWVFEWGSRVEFNAQPLEEGYEFAGWRTPGGDIIKQAHFVIDSITSDTSLVALFPPKYYNVKVRHLNRQRGEAYVGDPASQSIDSLAAYTSIVTIYAIPNEADGYEFQGWYTRADASAVLVSTANPYSYRVTATDTTFYAWFRDMRYNVNLTAVPQTGGVLKGAGMYTKSKDPANPTTMVHIEARANTGYDFLGWYEDTLPWRGGTYRPDVDFALEKSLFLIARFREKQAGLHLLAEPAASVDALQGEGSYKQDYNARIYAEPATGYEFAGWRNAKGEILSQRNPYLYPFNMNDTVLTAVMNPGRLKVDFNVQPVMSGKVKMEEACRYNQPAVAVAEPAYGYAFSHWLTPGGDSIKTAAGMACGAELRIVSTVDTAFTAVFKPLMRKVRAVYNAEGGRVTGQGDYAYLSTARLTAAANPHRVFAGWYNKEGKLLGVDSVWQCTVKEDVEVEARFEPTPTLSVLKVEPQTAGYIVYKERRMADTLKHGCRESVRLEAAGFAGYEFKQWCRIKDTDTAYFYGAAAEMVIEDSSLVIAVFDTMQYGVEVNVEPEHSGTVEGRGVYKHGAEISLLAQPQNGRRFVEYRDEAGRVLCRDAVYCLRADSGMHITAVFAPELYPLAVLSADEDGVTAGSDLYSPGDKAALSAWSMDLQKGFEAWTKNKEGTEILSRRAQYEYTFTATAPDTVYAQFGQAGLNLAVTVNNSAWGTVKGAGNYVAGAEAVLSAQPSTGYRLAGWFENGFKLEDRDTLRLEMTSNRELEASFTPNELKVELMAVTSDFTRVEGVEMHGAGTYKYGDNIYLEINSVPFGYKFLEWRAQDGNTLSTNASYTRVLQTNRLIYAVLGLQEYNITHKITGDGTVKGCGKFGKKENVVLTAVAAKNWRFAEWRLNGSLYSHSEEIEFEAWRDLEFEAVFVWDDATPQPDVNMAVAGGVYTLVSKGNRQVGLRALPEPGYDFLYWTYKGDSILTTERDCTFDVEESRYLTAHFAKSSYRVSLVTDLPDGVVSVSGSGSYRYGDAVSLGIELKEGYEFAGWFRNIAGGYTFVSAGRNALFFITEDMDIEARVVKIK